MRVVATARPQRSTAAGWSLATTSREREQYFRVMDVREAAARIVAEAQRAPAAVVFGAERTGLTNAELEAAHVLLRIPASEAYPSLNLAMAVQMVAYELLRARSAARSAARGGRRAAGSRGGDAAPLYALRAGAGGDRVSRPHRRVARTSWLASAGFLQRAELDANEVNILRGILTAVQNRRRHAGEGRAMNPVYLDYAATTPVDARVAAAMGACLTLEGDFGNASSLHAPGRLAAARIERRAPRSPP